MFPRALESDESFFFARGPMEKESGDGSLHSKSGSCPPGGKRVHDRRGGLAAVGQSCYNGDLYEASGRVIQAKVQWGRETMNAMRISAHVDGQHRLSAVVPDSIPPGPVTVVIVRPGDEDDAGEAWMAAVAREWEDELNDARQDIYTLADGAPVNGP